MEQHDHPEGLGIRIALAVQQGVLEHPLVTAIETGSPPLVSLTHWSRPERLLKYTMAAVDNVLVPDPG